MWNESLGKEIGRILNLIAEKPNRRPHPTEALTELFDGGEWTAMTGITEYRFSDGTTARYGTVLELSLTIVLATGEKVIISVPA